ncbi:hypothetical protein BH11MYX1_BH11MYX1_46540 [soil metagenome]
MSLLARFARVVARRGDAIAVEDPHTSLTYRQLALQANGVARQLVEAGLGVDDLVGVYVRPSCETIVALMGILEAGAAFVLLDLDYPVARLRSILEDSKLSHVIVDAAHRETPILADLTRLTIGEGSAASGARPEIIPSQLAYAVFTSGSTGRPKGVAVTHAGLDNLVEQQIEVFQISESSRVLQLASLGFDAVVSEVLTTLCAGATLCIEPRVPGLDLAAVLARRAITIVTAPPSLLRVIAAAAVPALRTVVSAGEACDADIVHRWAASRRMINAYGPSECTVCATMKIMSGPDDAPTIGVPMPGVLAHVFGPRLEPVECGTVGELYLGGPGLARGYLGKPALTAERFVPDPGAAHGERLYRTGDLVRQLESGELDYLGRTDDQVKIRGFRVEPREAEMVVREHRGVDDAIVLPRKRSDGTMILAAYVTSRDPSVDVTTIAAHVRERLPHFLRPSEIIVLSAWPMSPNGKVDRAALTALRPSAAAGRPAATATEREVEAITRRLLDRDAIDLDRGFFEQGGDSIAAVRLVLAIEATLHVNLSVAMLFEYRTLRALAGAIATRTSAAAPHSIVRPASSPFVRLRDGDGPTRLWMPGPVHGNALCYMRFAKVLGDRISCYGLQTPGLDGETTPIADFVALAAHQIETIRTVQPHGPYTLGGWSMGGSLSFEMAVQLEAAGEHVAGLVLIGATPPSADHLAAARLAMGGYESWRMAYFYLRTLAFSLELPLELTLDALRALPPDEVLERFTRELRALGPFGTDITVELAGRWLAIVRANLRGFHHHVPSGVFAGRVLSIHTAPNPLFKDALVRERVPPGSWTNHLVGTVDVRATPADHYTLMLEPWVTDVAAIVDGWLRDTAAQ